MTRSLVLAAAAGIFVSMGFGLDAGAQLRPIILTGGCGIGMTSHPSRGTMTVARSGANATIRRTVMPTMGARLLCRRSGYRASRLGDQTLDKKRTDVIKTVRADWREPSCSDGNPFTVDICRKKPSLAARADAACRAGKQTIQLSVGVRGVCTKVKFAIGKTHYARWTAPAPATFDLTCIGYGGSTALAAVTPLYRHQCPAGFHIRGQKGRNAVLSTPAAAVCDRN